MVTKEELRKLKKVRRLLKIRVAILGTTRDMFKLSDVMTEIRLLEQELWLQEHIRNDDCVLKSVSRK